MEESPNCGKISTHLRRLEFGFYHYFYQSFYAFCLLKNTGSILHLVITLINKHINQVQLFLL